MIVWGVPGVSSSLAFSISSITAPAGTVLFPTQWEHPHDLASLKKHLTILGDDLKPVLKILTDNARSLEDYINTAYLNVTLGGTVYGPVSLESGTTFNGAAVFNSTLTAGTITATTFSGSGSSLTNIPNSATTATSANTASAIVARDASGNFTAGTVTAALTGTASGNLVSGGALGTPSSGTLANCTFPTLNQNTTGSAGSVPYSGLTGTVPTWNQNTTGSSGSTTGSSASCTGNAATASDSSLLGGFSESQNTNANTIARRDTSSNIYANQFIGTDGSSQFYSTATETYIGQNCARVINSSTVYSQSVSGRTVLVSAAGTLGNTTSSRRYKENIVAYSDETNKLLTVNPVTFDYREGHLPEDEQEDRYNQFGLIAEDLHDAGLAHLVYYNAEGQPDAVDYLKIAVELLGVVKNLEARIRLLEARP